MNEFISFVFISLSLSIGHDLIAPLECFSKRINLKNSFLFLCVCVNQECDFEGCSVPAAGVIEKPSADEVVPSDRCHLAFSGLESGGRDLPELNAFVNFWVNPNKKVLTPASALEASATAVLFCAGCAQGVFIRMALLQ